MDWANETYVRLYVRDTKTWLKLGWQAHCIIGPIMRKLDRSGLLEGASDAGDVAVFLADGTPVEIIEAGLKRLTELSVFTFTEKGLLMPNFIDAQEASKSDKLRQKESRDKRRAVSRFVTEQSHFVTEQSRNVTEPSRPVTTCHDLSRPVTLCFADPLPASADPLQNKENACAQDFVFPESKSGTESAASPTPGCSPECILDSPPPAPDSDPFGSLLPPVATSQAGASQNAPSGQPGSTTEPSRDRPKPPDPMGDQLRGRTPGDRVDVRQVYETWKTTFGYTGAKLSQKNGPIALCILDAIKAYGAEECERVIREAPNDGMVTGKLDREGAKHDGLQYILGNEMAFARIQKAAREKATPKPREPTMMEKLNAIKMSGRFGL